MLLLSIFLDYTTQFQTSTNKESLTKSIFILRDIWAAKRSLSVTGSPSEIQESPPHSAKVTKRQRSSSDHTTLRRKNIKRWDLTPKVTRIWLRTVLFLIHASHANETNGPSKKWTCHILLGFPMDILRNIYLRRFISQVGDFFWPTNSPELTASDFCLWGALKVRVMQTCPAIMENKNSGEALPILYKESYRRHYPCTSDGKM